MGHRHRRRNSFSATCRITDVQLFKNLHYRLQLTDDTGENVKAMAFKASGTPLGEVLSDIRPGDAINAMGTLAVDNYDGGRSAYIRLEDIASP